MYVFGELFLDIFYVCDVNRISPEAPVPVINPSKKFNYLGGAGNFSSNLSSLGGKVNLITNIGNDKDSTLLKKLLSENLIKSKFIKSDHNIKKIRYVDSNWKHIIRIDFEKKIKQIKVDQIKKIIKKKEVSVISDYNKGLLSRTSIAKIIQLSSFLVNYQFPNKYSLNAKVFGLIRNTVWQCRNFEEIIECKKD